MAQFDGHLGAPARRDSLLPACVSNLAEAIRTYDSKALVTNQHIIMGPGPTRDDETLSLLLDGTLSHPQPDADPGRGMKRLKYVWKAQGRVNEEPGVYPAYQVELLIAEYENSFSRFVALGKRVDLKWVSPVSVGLVE